MLIMLQQQLSGFTFVAILIHLLQGVKCRVKLDINIYLMSIYHFLLIILLILLGLSSPHNSKIDFKCKCEQPIRDVTRDVLIQMAKDFNTAYLGIHKGKSKTSFNVKIWGQGTRIFTSLPVRLSQKGCKTQIDVVFIIDTGSPYTSLTAETLDTLYRICPKPQQIFIGNYITIAGFDLQVTESVDAAKNVNILGGDFMTLAGSELHVNYLGSEKNYASLKITPLKKNRRNKIDCSRHL